MNKHKDLFKNSFNLYLESLYNRNVKRAKETGVNREVRTYYQRSCVDLSPFSDKWVNVCPSFLIQWSVLRVTLDRNLYWGLSVVFSHIQGKVFFFNF